MNTTQFFPAFLSSPLQRIRGWVQKGTSADGADAYRDAFGLSAPVPAHHGQRRIPDEGFFSGPAVGERLPDFALRGTAGSLVDFHTDRAGAKAAVVFFRSAVW